jgi:hypothetical protein
MSHHSQRDNKLLELSQLIINGHITFKLDFIAHICINNHYYFCVFRRYNSPFEIVIEDTAGDVYLHKDKTIRESLQEILCLNDEDTTRIYTYDATSYKHNARVPTMCCDIADLKWSEVQLLYQSVNVNFRGILENFPDVSYFLPEPVKEENILQAPPSTPLHLPSVEVATPFIPLMPLAPNAPQKNFSLDDTETARILCSIKIPKMADLSESDEPSMSMRHQDVKQRTDVKQRHIPRCYCECEEDDDQDNEQNYIVLRNGTMIPKAH